jgi:hypothetical protein
MREKSYITKFVKGEEGKLMYINIWERKIWIKLMCINFMEGKYAKRRVPIPTW